MLQLDKTLQAWGTPEFEPVLKQEVMHSAEQLPLQQGLSTGNYVAAGPITVVLHSVTELENILRVKAGIFYAGVIGGCSCADDPSPASDNTEHCVVQLDIDKATAATVVMLVAE